MTTTSITVRCADKYEALKLASMALVRKSRQTFIASILDIIGNEVVVSLRDKSAHCIVMYSNADAEALAAYMQSVLEGADRVEAADAVRDVVVLEKAAAR